MDHFSSTLGFYQLGTEAKSNIENGISQWPDSFFYASWKWPELSKIRPACLIPTAKPFFNDQPMVGEIEMRLTKQKSSSKGSYFGQ